MTDLKDYRDPRNPGGPLIPREDWDRAPYNRWAFLNVRQMVPTAEVWRGPGPVMPLPEAPQNLQELEFESDGETLSVAKFLDESFTDGFLILSKGAIVTELYMNGMQRRTTHLSQSVAKSIVGTVASILNGRGELDFDAPVTEYLPDLAATAYRGATVQQVMDMTSGTLFDETYTSLDSHIAKVDAACGWKDLVPGWPKSMWQLITELKDAEAAHGESFRYRSIETDVIAFILMKISGLSLSELVSRELWSPMGADEDAYFTVDRAGYGLADGGFNATLRDYARFGQLIANGGNAHGRQIVPWRFIEDLPHGSHEKFGRDYRVALPKGAYHNQFWIEEAGSPVVMCRGVFGQLIYIDREADFVGVKLSTWPDFTNVRRTRTALAAMRAIRAAVA
ncbi:serine hydrolase domain-containing protein [Rhizobium sp.]